MTRFAERLARLERRRPVAKTLSVVLADGVVKLCRDNKALVALPDNGRGDLKVTA